jgi:hypothetical protein
MAATAKATSTSASKPGVLNGSTRLSPPTAEALAGAALGLLQDMMSKKRGQDRHLPTCSIGEHMTNTGIYGAPCGGRCRLIHQLLEYAEQTGVRVIPPSRR